MLLNCGVGEDSWESLGLQGDPTNQFWRRSALGFLWSEWCWSWNSSTLATSCEELTHWKRLWYWEGLGAGGEGDEPGWDGWMASLTRWTWVWVNSGSWWWTGRPGMLQFMESQKVGHDLMTELNWEVRYCQQAFHCMCYRNQLYWNISYNNRESYLKVMKLNFLYGFLARFYREKLCCKMLISICALNGHPKDSIQADFGACWSIMFTFRNWNSKIISLPQDNSLICDLYDF